MLTRIVAAWSTFTIATAGAFNFVSLVTIRFVFGMGEAGAWPCVASTFSRWIPAKERGTIQGIFFMGAHISGGLTPLLVAFLIDYLPKIGSLFGLGEGFPYWRVVFVLFGLVGFVWAVAWYSWFRDDPSEHRQVNAAERELILSGRPKPTSHEVSWAYWLRLATHRNTIPLCLMYVGNVWAYYFCITWFPKYLKSEFGLTMEQLGYVVGLPLLVSVLGDLFGGVTTDLVTRLFGLRIGRVGVGATAYAIAGVAMYFAAASGSATVCITLLSLAVAAAMFTLGAAWGTCIDIGGEHSGVVSATMNTAGNLSAMAVPPLVIFLRDFFKTWDAPLYMMAAMFLVGTVCWCFIDPRKRVFD